MSDSDDPQWNLLPDQPDKFFSLSGNYGVLDLKRSYSTLIKRFKPEKFPEEFQRIRAAYERLNDALRYGESPRSGPLVPGLQFEWGDVKNSDKQPISEEQSAEPFDFPVPDDTRGIPRSEPTQQAELHSFDERVSQEPLQNLYAELKTKQLKTPYDYYTLAVFSDLLPEEDFSFPFWILEGLKAHPEEPALFELLHQFFISSHSIDGIEKLLVSTSNVIRSDRFYYLTESVWDRLIRKTPFKTFKQVLESCEMNLLDHEVDHLLVFYVHILKAALWKADNEWINATFSEIETHYDRMPYWLEQEYEFLHLVKIYQEHRVEFLAGGPLRRKIDQAIIDYCTQNEQDADRSFLECQHVLVSQRDDLLDGLEVLEGGYEIIFFLWETIAEDVFERIDTELIEDNQESLEQCTHRLVSQLFEDEAGEEYKMAAKIPRLSFTLLFLLSMITALLCLIYKGESTSSTLFIIGSLLLFNGVVFFISVIVSDFVIQEFYRSWWRYKIIKFYQSNWFPLQDLAAELQRFNGKSIGENKTKDLNEIANLLRKDPGLWFYVAAQRLLLTCE